MMKEKHEWNNCPDCGTECSGEESKCLFCEFDLTDEFSEPSTSESDYGIDPCDY